MLKLFFTFLIFSVIACNTVTHRKAKTMRTEFFIEKFNIADRVLSGSEKFIFDSLTFEIKDFYCIELITKGEVYTQDYYFVSVDEKDSCVYVSMNGNSIDYGHVRLDHKELISILKSSKHSHSCEYFKEKLAVEIPSKVGSVIRVFKRVKTKMNCSVYILDDAEKRKVDKYLNSSSKFIRKGFTRR